MTRRHRLARGSTEAVDARTTKRCPVCGMKQAACDVASVLGTEDQRDRPCAGWSYRAEILVLRTALAPLAELYEAIETSRLANSLDAVLARTSHRGKESVVRVCHARDASFVLRGDAFTAEQKRGLIDRVLALGAVRSQVRAQRT